MRSGVRRGVERRAIASSLAVLAVVGLAGGCSSGHSTSASELAAQDKAVAGAIHVEAIRSETAAAERRLVQLRRRAAIAATLRNATRFPRALGVLARFGFSLDDLCPRHRPRLVSRADQHAQREQDRQRRRALYYLNLACPSDTSRA